MSEPHQTAALFDLPEYDRAFKTFFWRGTSALARAKSPLLGLIPTGSTAQVTATVTTLASGEQIVVEPVEGESTFTFDWRSVVEGDLGSILDAIDDAAAQQAAQIVPKILEHLGAITEASGQTVDAGGKPISHELILATMEKLDIDFDAEGKPLMPTLVVHPKIREAIARLSTPTAEQNAAWQAMLDRKREEFRARRRTRRIS